MGQRRSSTGTSALNLELLVLPVLDANAMLSLFVARRCYFRLGAIGQLAAGRARLDKAQQSLQRSHGPSGSRMRRLHGNFCPELAM